MLRKIFISLTTALIAFSAHSQDSTRTFVISGSADGYYRYNFNDPKGGTNNYTSFTNSQNSFELGMATVRADASAMSGKLSATADLGFGRRAEEFSYPDGSGYPVGTGNKFNTLAAVKQLYINYTPGKYWTFTIGKWATHIGYEVLDAYANRNYSMDYMFSYGPFSHTGIKAQYAKGNFGLMVGIANPSDNVTTASSTKTLIGQLSDSVGSFKLYLNYQGFFGSNLGLNPMGLKSMNQIDLVGSTAVSSKFGIGFNGTVQFRTTVADTAQTWWGAAVYLNYDPSAKIGWTLRGEYLGNSDYALGLGKDMTDLTLSMNYRVGSQFTIIPELRFDGSGMASNGASGIFYKADGSTPTNSTFTGLLAVVYKF